VLNTFALQVDGVYSFFLLSLVELEHGIRNILTYAYFPEDLSVKMKNKYLLPRFFSSETDTSVGNVLLYPCMHDQSDTHLQQHTTPPFSFAKTDFIQSSLTSRENFCFSFQLNDLQSSRS